MALPVMRSSGFEGLRIVHPMREPFVYV